MNANPAPTSRPFWHRKVALAAGATIAGALAFAPPAHATIRGDTITVAGTGVPGTTDGPGLTATIRTYGVGYGLNSVFMLDNDFGHHCIRRLDAANVVSTFAGSCTGPDGYLDGPKATAKFSYFGGIAVNAQNQIIVADGGNNRIRVISTTGIVSTLAGSTAGFVNGPGSVAKFHEPSSVVVDPAGNTYVVDIGNNAIRKVDQAGNVTTIAGTGAYGSADGPGATATFCRPNAIARDASGNLYVTDTGNNRIRKISPAGSVTTYAGAGPSNCIAATPVPTFADGPAGTATFYSPVGIAVDSAGIVYVADSGNNRIRAITPGRVTSTLAGTVAGFSDGSATGAKFLVPKMITIGPLGLYVADGNYRVRLVTL